MNKRVVSETVRVCVNEVMVVFMLINVCVHVSE